MDRRLTAQACGAGGAGRAARLEDGTIRPYVFVNGTRFFRPARVLQITRRAWSVGAPLRDAWQGHLTTHEATTQEAGA
jgi:hypothetical protein